MTARHKSTFAPFCPGISTKQDINYSDSFARALLSYPGAKDDNQALIFALKHTEMRVENAIMFYSEEAHKRDSERYASTWVERYMDQISYLGATR